MKVKYLKVILPLITIIALGVFATFNVNASIDSKSASEFSQYCSQNSSVCNKVDFSEATSGNVSCPTQNQNVTEVYVHAGDGQTVYKLPQDGFGYTINGNSTLVTVSGHPHAISWIAIVCNQSVSISPSPTHSPSSSPTQTSSPSPTPTPTLTPNPTYSPSPSPLPSATPTPSSTPTSGGGTGDNNNITNDNSNDNNQNQSQAKDNNQTVNVTVNQRMVLGANTPKILPETGVSVLGLAPFFSVAPFGLILARFGWRKSIYRKKEELGNFAVETLGRRNQGLDNL